MKGNNEMILNESTMIEAMQFWLDSRMVQPVPTVTGVKTKTDGYNKMFEVSLSDNADRVGPTTASSS